MSIIVFHGSSLNNFPAKNKCNLRLLGFLISQVGCVHFGAIFLLLPGQKHPQPWGSCARSPLRMHHGEGQFQNNFCSYPNYAIICKRNTGVEITQRQLILVCSSPLTRSLLQDLSKISKKAVVVAIEGDLLLRRISNTSQLSTNQDKCRWQNFKGSSLKFPIF